MHIIILDLIKLDPKFLNNNRMYRKEGCQKFEMSGCINVPEFYLVSYLAFIHDLKLAECVLLANHVAFDFERLTQDCDL